MNIKFANTNLSDIETDLLIVVVTAEEIKRKPKSKGKKERVLNIGAVNSALQNTITPYLSEFKAKADETRLIAVPGNKNFKSLLVVGWEVGGDNYQTITAYRKLGGIIFDNAKKAGAAKLTLSSFNLDLKRAEHVNAISEGVLLSGYNFDQYRSKPDTSSTAPQELLILSSVKTPESVLRRAVVLCTATKFARDLINTPPNDCTPRFLVKAAKDVAKSGKLQISVLEKSDLTKMGANALLAVAKGSEEPPYLIKLVYRPKRKRSKVISIVGKGVTFDSGGLSIKPGPSMESMKMDMSGAAAVLGAMQAIAELKPAVEVRAYIPTTENMINGFATRPGDIVKALSGKTIEILNTDAEGRLILADALTLALKEKCNAVIDLATLTGACVVALGPEYAGLFATDDKLATKLVACGEVEGERFWRLPLAKEYKELIKSTTADIKNIGGPWGGAITGALFLNEFVDKTPWAHLDIAGPAFADTDKGWVKKGGVGFGVRTLVRYILDQ